MKLTTRLLLATLLLPVVACSTEEIVPEPYVPTGVWDAYRHGLESAGLADTALGRDWIAAADDAVARPVEIGLPYREEGLFDARQAHAAGYRFTAARGQRIEVLLDFAGEREGHVFMDLYRLTDDGRLHVASADPASGRLAFEPRRDAGYVLRLQPELLRGGRYTLEVRTVASLDFPVQARDTAAIQSRFGASRDAGRRSHRGVDIFAPRGTPVVAAAGARVRRVDETQIGGKVIWLYDERRRASLYYAHLDAQEIEEGARVEPGQVIGRVGNTGNARTTPPHLHFGIYVRGEGAVDPWPFLEQPRGRVPALRVDTARVGHGVTLTAASSLRQRPSARSDTLSELAPGTPLRIWAAAGSYYRVAVGDELRGFIGQSALPPISGTAAGGSGE